jgi:hypothetical protein
LYGGFAMAEVWVDEVDDLEVTTFLPIVMPTTVAEMISAAAVPLKPMYNEVFTFKKKICFC